MPEEVSRTKYFIAGGFGGVGTVLVGHPFDTIKVRMQAMPAPVQGELPMYSGTWDCVKQTYLKERFRGFYKGMSAPLVAIVPIFALSFFGYGLGKRLQQTYPGEELSKRQLFAAGSFSGFFTTIVTSPGERVKALMQVQDSGSEVKYHSSGHAFVMLFKEGGIRSLYKGTTATLLRDVPSCGVYFLTYEAVQEQLASKYQGSGVNKVAKIFSTVVAGGLAGVAMWLVATPADVLKTRQQTAAEGRYNNIREVFVDLMRESGPRGLYKGIAPVLVRAFPANAACFLCFETAMTLMNHHFPNL